MITPIRIAITTAVVLLPSLLGAGSLYAQQTPAPAPAPEVKKTVDAFIGRWTLDATVAMPGQRPAKSAVRMDCRKTAFGKGAACSMTGKLGAAPFDASVLVAYDAHSKAVHFMAVTSDDEVHDHKCSWKSEESLVCEPLKGGMSGMAITEDLSFTVGPKKLACHSVITMPDGSKATFDGISR